MSIPRPGGPPFVTDAGMETELIFRSGFELPEFAAFPLIDDPSGREALIAYYNEFAGIASSAGANLLLAAPTWRASGSWGEAVGYDAAALDRVNKEAVELMGEIGASWAGLDVAISGVVGPLGDAYLPDTAGNVSIFRTQIASLAAAGADVVEALTFPTVASAVDVVRAANDVGIPVAILFTVETNGALPDGTSLKQAVELVEAAGEVAYFGVNCAHPSHLAPALDGGAWQTRIAELRPNASRLSHEELDVLEHLDPGDITDLVSSVEALRTQLPGLSVVGGCCGTGAAHVAALWDVALV